MTQEFLALMLCVHRPGVTIAARLFQQAGLIRYAQGHITVTDRHGLEAAACECYATVRRRTDGLLQGPAQR
jgi:Mn-dependent DtxR family transcriptional regulator